MNNIHLEYNPMFVTASYVTYVDNIDLSKISEHVNYLDKHVPNVRRQRSNAGGFQTEDIHPLPYDFEETGKNVWLGIAIDIFQWSAPGFLSFSLRAGLVGLAASCLGHLPTCFRPPEHA